MARVRMAAQRPKNGLPAAAQFNQLRAFLISGGMTNTQINEVVGTTAGQKNWGQMADALREWLQNRPKAT